MVFFVNKRQNKVLEREYVCCVLVDSDVRLWGPITDFHTVGSAAVYNMKIRFYKCQLNLIKTKHIWWFCKPIQVSEQLKLSLNPGWYLSCEWVQTELWWNIPPAVWIKLPFQHHNNTAEKKIDFKLQLWTLSGATYTWRLYLHFRNLGKSIS